MYCRDALHIPYRGKCLMDSVSFLEELVSIPSPSGQEDSACEFLVEQMAALGFEAGRDEAGNAVGVGGKQDAAREIVLMGHIDTVLPNLPMRRRGQLLYGRGTVDAKGPLAAFVLAAARTKLQGTRLLVVGAVGEEDPRGWGAHHLASTRPSPACVLVGEPSHWEGITLGYKGILSVDYRWVQPSGHSAGSRAAAAEKAITFWNRVMDYAELISHGLSGHFDTLDPALREFHTFNQESEDGVRMNVVVRLPPAFDVEDLKHKMIAWSDQAELSFSGYEPAVRFEKNTPPVRAMLRAIRAEGGAPRFKLKTGTSDMNVVARMWTCPMVAYGPGDSTLDHTQEEHVDLEEYKRSINVLVRALQALDRMTM
jgi:LysW-gamma-L-lysine carboxypeptidase